MPNLDAFPALSTFRFLTATKAFAAGDSGLLLRTMDGETWSRVQLGGARDNLHDIAVPSPKVVYVAGDSGELFKTRDGGVTWDSLRIGSGAVHSIEFPEELIGFASITSAKPDSLFFRTPAEQLLKTEDGGHTWKRFGPVNYFGALHFITAESGCAVTFSVGQQTSRIRLECTQDGGVTWTIGESLQGGLGGVGSIRFPDTDTGFALAAGHLMRTADRGRSWTSDPYAGYLFGTLDFLDTQLGFATTSYTNRPQLLTTTDGGLTWRARMDASSIEAIQAIAAHTVYGLAQGRLFKIELE